MYTQGICILIAVLLCALDLWIAYSSAKKHNRLGRSLAFTNVMIAVVVLSYLFSILMTDYFAVSVASSIFFISIDLVLNGLIAFTVCFTGRSRSNIIGLIRWCSAVILAVDCLALIVNPFCEVAISYVLRDTVVAHYAYRMHFMYYFHLAYCYVMIAIVAVMLVSKALVTPIEYSTQYLFTTLALSLIVWVNTLFLYVPSDSVWHQIDVSIIGYSLSAAFIYWCSFVYPHTGMLSRLRNGIFESIDQGIVLFDLENRMILHNNSAVRLLPEEALKANITIEAFAAICGISAEECCAEKHASIQCHVVKNGEAIPLRLDYRRLLNGQGLMLGQLFVLSDAAQEIDRLTGFQNWETFRKLVRKNPEHYGYPTTAAVFDINGLGQINRTRGNDAGDALLVELAEKMREMFPRGFRFVRGQDSSLLVLCSGGNEQETGEIAGRLRKEFSGSVQFALSVASREEGNVLPAVERAEAALHLKKLIDPASVHSALVSSLISTMEEWDGATGLHMKRTQQMCLALGRELKLCDADMSTLSLFALLHDIGKVGTPLEILHKPGWMTEDEVSILHSHVTKGYQIARSTPELQTIAPLIRSHHERWDGQGYPDGLKGEKIPYPARILAVVDAYDAMTHDRIYRKALSPEEAEQELKKCAGTQFDPMVVYRFRKVLRSEHFQTDYDAQPASASTDDSDGLREQSGRENHFYPLRYSRYLLDTTMTVISADDQFEALTGYTREDVEARGIRQNDLILPEERQRYFETVKKILQEKPIIILEHSLVRKDGRLVSVFCIGRLYFDAVVMEERSEIFIADYRDTNAVKRMEADARLQAQMRMEQWEDAVRRDPLTGLLNHPAFISMVMKCVEEQDPRALMILMDIDNFKLLNDRYGHPAGDEILVHTALSLLERTGQRGYVGRLGGDEFAVLLKFPEDTGKEAMYAQGKTLFEDLNDALKQGKYPCTVSAGAEIVKPGSGFSMLYEQADNALYYSKNHGRSRYSIKPEAEEVSVHGERI